MSLADARETIYRLIRESRGDRIGGMSVYSMFLDVHREADDETAGALLRALGQIVESDSDEMLIAGVWLAGAIAGVDILDDYLEQAVRRRLVDMESVADKLGEGERHELDALRRADAEIANAKAR